MAINVFEKLNNINVNDHTEDKNGLTYLSWVWAWAEVKKNYPSAEYNIIKFNGLPYAYDERTGYMVYTTVTIDEKTHEMWLPVMDGSNKAMKSQPYEYTVKNPKFKYAKFDRASGKYLDKYGNEQREFLVKKVEAATMFDVNKAIMRCLVKNLAMFGLGLYIYAGEDLPEAEKDSDYAPEPKLKPQKALTKGTRGQINAKIVEYAKLTNKDVAEITEELQRVAQVPLQEITDAQGQQLLAYLDEKIDIRNLSK